MYIIGQILGFIAFIASLYAYQRVKKRDILISMVLSNSINLIHYFLIGAYSGCITKILAILRDLFIVLKEKNKRLSSVLFLIIFILIYTLVSIYTFTNILSLFPLIAAIIYIIPTWLGDSKTVKRTALFCYVLWLIYNIYVLSIAGVIANIVSIVSIIIGFKREIK